MIDEIKEILYKADVFSNMSYAQRDKMLTRLAEDIHLPYEEGFEYSDPRIYTETTLRNQHVFAHSPQRDFYLRTLANDLHTLLSGRKTYFIPSRQMDLFDLLHSSNKLEFQIKEVRELFNERWDPLSGENINDVARWAIKEWTRNRSLAKLAEDLVNNDPTFQTTLSKLFELKLHPYASLDEFVDDALEACNREISLKKQILRKEEEARKKLDTHFKTDFSSYSSAKRMQESPFHFLWNQNRRKILNETFKFNWSEEDKVSILNANRELIRTARLISHQEIIPKEDHWEVTVRYGMITKEKDEDE